MGVSLPAPPPVCDNFTLVQIVLGLHAYNEKLSSLHLDKLLSALSCTAHPQACNKCSGCTDALCYSVEAKLI
jgi:hypothetical protein